MSRRRRLVLLLALLLGLPLLLLAAAAVFIATFDGSGYRGTVERLLSDATGRACVIQGFRIDLSSRPRVRAEGIALGNTSWSTHPDMIAIRRFQLELDAWSLWSGPLHVTEVMIEGVEVRLEVDPERGPNWLLEPAPAGDRGEAGSGLLGRGLVVDRLALAGARLTYRDADRERELVLDGLEAGLDAAGDLSLDLAGRLDQAPMTLAGKLGPLPGLWEGGELQGDLDGRLDDATLKLSGSLADPRTLSGPALDLAARGDSLENLARNLGLPVLGSGPFRLAADIVPGEAGLDVTLEADLDRFSVRLRGQIDQLIRPSRLETSLEAQGPDLARLGAWLNEPRLPPGAFALAGGALWENGEVTVSDLRIEAGGGQGTISGRLGRLPDPAGTDLRLDLAGPDLSVWSGLAGVDLPGLPYQASGRAVGADAGIRLQEVSARLGETRLKGDGLIGPLPGLAGTDLELEVEGPDLAAVGRLMEVDLPAGPFGVEGRLRGVPGGYDFEGVDARLAESRARVGGRLALAEAGFTLTLEGLADGPDLAALMTRVLRPYVEDVPPLPQDPFDVSGWFRMAPDGYRVEGLRVTLGDVSAEVTGGIGREPMMDGLDATFSAQAETPGLLSLYLDLPPLPAGAVSLAGRVTAADGRYRLHDVSGGLGPNRFRLDADLGRPADLPDGLDAVFDLSGPDLSAFADLSPRFPLPALPYTASGRLAIAPVGYKLTGVDLGLGEAAASLDGLVGPLPDLRGTDVAVDSRGLLVAWIEEVAGLDFPAEVASISGRFHRDEGGLEFERVQGGLGEHRFAVDGRLGDPPGLIGTDLRLEADGPSLAPWAATLGLEYLPAEPYDLKARFEGTPASFRLNDLAARLGDSDLAGSGSLDWGETPTVTAALASRRLDLTPLIRLPGVEPEAGPEAGVETGAGTDAPRQEGEPARGRRVFTDEPLDLSLLARVDGQVRFTGDRLIWQGQELVDADLDMSLTGGHLVVDHVTATGPRWGWASGRLAIEPVPEGYRITAEAWGEDLRFSLLGSGAVDPALWPPVRFDLDLAGHGATPHDLVSSLDGHVWILQGAGKGDNKIFERLSSDVLLEIFNILNPFAREDVSSSIECGLYAVDIEGGVARMDALVLRTEKVTVGGQGRINFEKEKLDLTWTSKPRKGIGLSAGSLVNSYIKLGGTLARPQVEIKPLEAAVTTGAAVATAGLSIAARGLWDRLTAEKNPCKKGVPALEKRMDEEGHQRTDSGRLPP